MSHFACLVIGEDVEKQLAPFHEFECTGTDDQFVQSVDRTEEARAEYATGGKDQPFQEWAARWYGSRIVEEGLKPDTESADKYGYIIRENGEWRVIKRTNPRAKWDWWVIGGRFSNFFTLRNGTEASETTKRDVDFDRMRADDGDRAGRTWDAVHKVIDQSPSPEAWDIIRERNGGDMDKSREEYRAQPMVKAFNDAKLYDRNGLWVSILDGVEKFSPPREEYVKAARDAAISMFAILKDGEWIERGRMGWWACVSGEMDEGEWNAKVAEALDALSGDTLLTIVDCHI